MENTILYVVLSFLLPILFLCVYLEKRARRIMISFCGGILACMVAYSLNALILNYFSFSDTVYTVLLSPIVEELLKFFPILIISLIVNKGRRGSTANAYAVGIGFCLVENTTFLIQNMSTSGVIWVLFRSIGTGLMHGMSATILGLGFYTARHRENHKGILISLTVLLAIVYHSLFNFLVSGNAVCRVIAVLMPLVTHFSIFFFVKREDIHRFFSDSDEIEDEKAKKQKEKRKL